MITLKDLICEDDDYDPAWDYNVHPNPPPRLVKIVNDIINSSKKLISALNFDKIRISYIKDDREDALARYINGTHSSPYIVINIDVIVDLAKKNSLNIGRELEITIVHELVHAYLESIGLDVSEQDEDVVEGAAIEYMNFRDPIDIINYINDSYPHLN